MKHFIIVNGLDHAFLREFGCPCKRYVRQRSVANTSVSLVSLNDSGDQILHHILFDTGMGVVDKLVDSPYLSGNNAHLDWLIVSHWHPDHLLDLNRLCETWRRTLKRWGKEWKPIPTWCRSGTAEWLKRNHTFEWNSFLKPQLSNETSPPGATLTPIQLDIAGLTVTPITVSHHTADINPANPKEQLPFCASFVIETDSTKTVLLWDIDNRNNWIENPNTNEQKKTVNLLSEADYLFIDCNTWSVEEVNGKNTGHISFSTARRYIMALHPKRQTLLVHLSVHEDGEYQPGWGWLDWKWEQEAQRVWQAESLPGIVRVPTSGEEFII